MLEAPPKAVAELILTRASEARTFCRKVASEDPEYFLRYVLGYDVKPFHLAWFRFQAENRRSILLAARGHGKSTIANIGYILWRLTQNQNLRVLIASKTARQASLFLSEIKQHMALNPTFRAIYGDWVRQDEWKEMQIRIPRTAIMKEPTITAIGIGGSLPTWHFDLIVVDDPHDLSNSQTQAARDAVWRWYEEVLLPTLEPGGEIHIIGTRWHADDLFGRLIATGGYAVMVSPALDEEGRPLWPERFTAEDLAKIRQEMGSTLFSMQYLCRADRVLIEGAVFRYADFRFATEEQARQAIRHPLAVVQAWDLAVGTKEVVGDLREATRELGDYTAGVTVVLTRDHEFYVVDWWRGRPGLAGQIKAIKDFAEKWEPDVIAVEAVAYQAVLSHHLMRTTTLPIKPVRPDRDKVRRAWLVQPYVETGRVWFTPQTRDLAALIAEFPFGEEDDSVDAWVYAMLVAAQRERAGQRTRRVVQGV